LIPFVLLLSVGAGQPSWTAAPVASKAVLALEAPPAWPEHWVVEEGLYAAVAGDPADRAAARRIARHVEEAVPRIAGALDLPTGRRLRVYVAHSQEEFSALQPGDPADWVDATAYPHRALIFLRAPRLRHGMSRPIEQVIDHEITHILVEQSFHGAPVPRWLHEGLAQVMAREFSEETTQAIAQGMLGDGLISLDSLVEGFPRDPLRARLAYAQSADLVAFIRNEFGEESLQVLIKELAAGAAVPAAFREATGQRLDEVDAAWRARLEGSQLWFPPLVSDSVWFAFGGLMLFAGWLRVRRRNRERRAWMEREEELQRQLDVLWAQHLGRQPSDGPGDEVLRSAPGVMGPVPRDGWASGPAPHRLRGWISDEELSEGIAEDDERPPWSHPLPRDDG
jgi:hypothetical protein